MTNPIGPLPQAPAEYNQAWANSLIDRLDQILALLSRVAETGYQVSNVTTDRDLDCNLATDSHTITDATVTPVAAGSIETITGAALSTGDVYTDAAVNAEIDTVVANLRAAIDTETDTNTALMEAAIDAVIAANNTNVEVALDANGTDILTLADVIGTLIIDMKNRGWLGG